MKILTLLISLFIFTNSLNAGDKENVIKGVILERISQFIAYKGQRDFFNICIYKDEKLSESFDILYKNRTYKSIPIEVKNINSLDEIDRCNILYTRNLNKNTMNKILSMSLEQTLLVTEDISYVYDGFMIALYFEDKKLQFAINQTAISQANMKVNYRLLKVASKLINPIKEKQ